MRSCLAATMLLAAATMPAISAPRVSSSVKGVVLTPLGDLPRSPSKAPLDEFCQQYRIQPKTQAGQLVAGRGWIVTSEAELGIYEAVSFAGSFEPGTSGVCYAHDGNIAIFEEGRLVALAYTAKSADRTLGTLAPIEPDNLLIHGGEGPSVPVGELHATGDGLRISPLARLQPVCSGRAIVPNVYGLGIRTARKVLMDAGWKPERPSEAPTGLDYAATFAKEGVIEAVSCSGTGYGFCSFDYRSTNGGLSVTTMGEDYAVVSYVAGCR